MNHNCDTCGHQRYKKANHSRGGRDTPWRCRRCLMDGSVHPMYSEWYPKKGVKLDEGERQ
jgi:hypothetical protein